MNISIQLNCATKVKIQTYNIMNTKIKEPIWDGYKHNFIIYSFYFIVKFEVKNDNLFSFDLFKENRLYYRYFKINTESENGYVIVRAISDDLIEIQEAIKKLKRIDCFKEFAIINQNIELSNTRNLDEYHFGKFLDTQIDKATLPFS